MNLQLPNSDERAHRKGEQFDRSRRPSDAWPMIQTNGPEKAFGEARPEMSQWAHHGAVAFESLTIRARGNAQFICLAHSPVRTAAPDPAQVSFLPSRRNALEAIAETVQRGAAFERSAEFFELAQRAVDENKRSSTESADDWASRLAEDFARFDD